MQSALVDSEKTYRVHRGFPPILLYIPGHRHRSLHYSLYSQIHTSRCNFSRMIHSYILKKIKMSKQNLYRLKRLDSFIDLYLIELSRNRFSTVILKILKSLSFHNLVITLITLKSIESRFTTMQAAPVYMMTLFVLQAVSTYTSAALSKCIIATL